jgi:hypothetical protein
MRIFTASTPHVLPACWQLHAGRSVWPNDSVFSISARSRSALIFYLWAFALERTTPTPNAMAHLVNIAVATCSFCPDHTISRTKSIALSVTASVDSKDP